MNTNKINPLVVWKQLDDHLVPNLALNVFDRAVYSFLLRHTRLEGKRRLHFSMAWLARGVRVSIGAARPAMRRLLDRGALRLIHRSKSGHLIEVLLPNELRSVRLQKLNDNRVPRKIDDLDFFRNPSLRKAIHARERGVCFYCLRRLHPTQQCLDHVVPQSCMGGNSYRNLVSCCMECNSAKNQTPATDFLRWLYRQRRLTSLELDARLRALPTWQRLACRLSFSCALPRSARPPFLHLDRRASHRLLAVQLRRLFHQKPNLRSPYIRCASQLYVPQVLSRSL